MTLKEWSEKTGILPTYPTTEKYAVSLISTPDKESLHYDLWHLEDYVVSSVCGIVIWLVPRVRGNVPPAYLIPPDFSGEQIGPSFPAHIRRSTMVDGEGYFGPNTVARICSRETEEATRKHFEYNRTYYKASADDCELLNYSHDGQWGHYTIAVKTYLGWKVYMLQTGCFASLPKFETKE